jgi:hypothetical protein
MAIKPQTFTADDALESGVIGTVYDPIENDAYTVSGQGEDTAAREREASPQAVPDTMAGLAAATSRGRFVVNDMAAPLDGDAYVHPKPPPPPGD